MAKLNGMVKEERKERRKEGRKEGRREGGRRCRDRITIEEKLWRRKRRAMYDVVYGRSKWDTMARDEIVSRRGTEMELRWMRRYEE